MRILRGLVWVPVVPALVWAGVRLSGWDRGVLVQLLPFTTYAAVWAWIAVVVAIVARRRLAAGVAVLTAVVLTVLVMPRALPDSGPTGGVAIRVMTSNMHLGDADPATIVALVRDNQVDVLALQEFTPAAQAGLTAAGLGALLPFGSYAPEAGASGSALYSRLPLTGIGSERNRGNWKFLQAYATVQPAGAQPVRIESVHPAAPSEVGGRTEAGWRGDLADEPGAQDDGIKHILIGDFNSTLDHPELRKLIARGYRDAADAAGGGLVPTWGIYLNERTLPPITIDHVLVEASIGVRDTSVHRVPDTDHRALIAGLRLPAAN